MVILKATPRPGARAVDQILRRLRKMPVPRNDYVIERGLRTPTRDGAMLLGDLYSPTDHDARTATILIRTPYGRGLPVDALWGRTFAWCSSRRGNVSGCSVTGSSSALRRRECRGRLSLRILQ